MSKTVVPGSGHPFRDLLGFSIDAVSGGTSRLSLAIGQEHMNPFGMVNGAVLFALADTGMGLALGSSLESSEGCTTLEVKINYFRPWKEGLLTCENRLVHRGRTTAVLASDLFDAAGRHLAQASGTFAIVQR